MLLQNKKVQLNFIFTIIAIIEIIVAGIFTLLISPDPKNAWLFGFSRQRWALAMFGTLLSVLVLIAGVWTFKKKTTFHNILQINKNAFWYKPLLFVVHILILWGWCSIVCPPFIFNPFANYFERIRPLSITIGLLLIQWSALSYFIDKLTIFKNLPLFDRNKPFFKTSLFFAVCLELLFIFVGVTKIGLVKKIAFWNVAGIPITGLQFLFVILVISLGVFFYSSGRQPESRLVSKFIRFLPLIIYFGAALVWGLTPMLKHYFSLQPTPPTFQPLPWSDARWLDLGSLSILRGFGINFSQGSDKPLYMIFLAILHIFSGNNYSLLTWLQILVLSIIPVVLFLFGRRFFGLGFGVFLALITILRERNAIVLSYKIASVNPKLLMSEMMTLLGIVLFSYIIFLLFRNPKSWMAILAGGVLGATSLIRMNSLLLYPLIGCLTLVAYWKFPKIKWRLAAFYTLGFFIVVSPWFFTGVDQNGTPWILDKINSIIKNRYQPLPQNTKRQPGLPVVLESINNNQEKNKSGKISTIYLPISTPSHLLSSSLLPLPDQINNSFISEKLSDILNLFTNHFLHNITTSTLALPVSSIYENQDSLILRPYWIEGNEWDGSLPAIQDFSIFIDIILMAIGLGYSWHRYRWAGLVPLIIFLGYDLSLGFAMNSGSRYIVPIDWILYFYYGLSLVGIIRWVINLIHGQEQAVLETVDEPIAFVDNGNKKRMMLSIIILIIIASLIPFANSILPVFINHFVHPENLGELVKSIPNSQKGVKTISFGEILYPYYDLDLTLDFTLLSGSKIIEKTININQQPLKETLYGGEKILVGMRRNKEIEYIYLIRGSSLELVWERNPVK